MSTDLKNKITEKKATIAVIGLGYVGLPLAVNFAKTGFSVLGLDKDKDRVSKIQQKQSYILDVSSNEIEQVVQSGKFSASLNFKNLSLADVIIICVPTPSIYTPAIDMAGKAVAKVLRPWNEVVLRSTCVPGTTRQLDALLRKESGLDRFETLYMGEYLRSEDDNDPLLDFLNPRRLIIGQNPVSFLPFKLKLIFQEIRLLPIEVSWEEAELAKLMHNNVNAAKISLFNEIWLFAKELGINGDKVNSLVSQTAEACWSQSYGTKGGYPFGGACLPKDLQMTLDLAKGKMAILKEVQKVNEHF